MVAKETEPSALANAGSPTSPAATKAALPMTSRRSMLRAVDVRAWEAGAKAAAPAMAREHRNNWYFILIDFIEILVSRLFDCTDHTPDGDFNKLSKIKTHPVQDAL
mmetsp:Transcript_1005/g.1450  ORF Transcript_1005/g.1450 Transcript_1005/m.1450 type:complete len:106 (+) Transcript_1005:478-795(+)